MSKGLCNIHPIFREEAIGRRLGSHSMGLGFWGAVDSKLRGVPPHERRGHIARMLKFYQEPTKKQEE
jgi:hypothetical protein